MYDEPYDPHRETVKEYVNRHLDAAMKEEADKWADSILHGDNSGGPLMGILEAREKYETRPREELD